MMNAYSTPELTKFGSIASLTAAIGASSQTDFDSRSDTFGQGSFDICESNDPDDCNRGPRP